MCEFLYKSDEVAKMLGVGKRTALRRIKEWNARLKAKGYHIEHGKIPKVYFHEINPYIAKEKADSSNH